MTDDTPLSPNRDAQSPFASGMAGGIVGKLLLGVSLAGAVGAAWWFTRAAVPAASAVQAQGASSPSGNPVMLKAGDADRIGVTYAVVERGPLTSELRTVGIVAYDETRVKAIAPKVDGYVEQLFVAFTGQSVSANDPLLQVYSPMLVAAQEELLLARKLVADVGTGNVDAARNAESLLAGARRRLRNWDIPDEDIARIEQSGQATRSLTLRSPLTGVVVQKNIQSGQRIMAGDVVYQVADLHEVWLEGEVFERDLPAVRLGQTVTSEFAATPASPRTGRIVYVASSVAPDTRTTKIRVALANHDMALKPGMYATIHIRGDASASVLSVPRSAVLVTGQRVLVFVRSADGMLVPRDVTLGATTDERVAITRGVTAGETVVSSATFLVDAESNLGSALGTMAGMPGMDMGPPKVAPKPNAKTPDPMADMPGMDHSKPKKP